MKKYKIYFSVFNLFEETQKEVVRLQLLVKTLSGMLAGISFLATSPDMLLIVGIGGFFVDLLLACFWFEKVETENKETANLG